MNKQTYEDKKETIYKWRHNNKVKYTEIVKKWQHENIDLVRERDRKRKKYATECKRMRNIQF